MRIAVHDRVMIQLGSSESARETRVCEIRAHVILDRTKFLSVSKSFLRPGKSFPDLTRSHSGRTKQVFTSRTYLRQLVLWSNNKNKTFHICAQTSSYIVFKLDHKCSVTVSDKGKILPVKT